MATLQDFRNERLRKLEELKKLGINPYPAKSSRTHTNLQIVSEFDDLEGLDVKVAGRITSIRKFGKIAFIVIRDMTGDVQLFWRAGDSKPNAGNSEIGIENIALLDTGDFVECAGKVIKTKTGEISVEIEKLRLLTKALRPMPNDQEGFTDKEQRMRRRYVDMNVNRDVRKRFERRSMFWKATRDFMNERDFLEINVPVLEHTTGGADANPFVTHMDALDQDFYLRISHELPLKKLIGAGFEKVYDIGPRFRNENYSDEHLPEHVAMEWYWAYADWESGMKLMEDMFGYILKQTFGTLKFKVGGMDVDMSKKWVRWDYAEIIKKHYGLDVYDCTISQVQEQLKKHKLEVEKTENIPRGIDKLWKNIRKDVVGPVWLVNTPAFISPLAKTDDKDPRMAQRYQAVIAGSELCNGYSELNDPIDQLDRFMEQEAMREAGDNEAMMLDIDFVEMLEYGLPPTTGLGFSERVFWIFEGVTAREGVPFPQLKSEIDGVTKAIYPEVFESGNTHNGNGREQDFSKRIIAVVRKDLEPWRVANAVAHMQAIIGNKIPHKTLTSGDYFVGSDGVSLPRNSQYPIIIMKGEEKDLRKLHKNVQKAGLINHVFIKEMQDTTNDSEIVDILMGQAITDTEFFGVSFFADNDQAKELTKNFQLWK